MNESIEVYEKKKKKRKRHRCAETKDGKKKISGSRLLCFRCHDDQSPGGIYVTKEGKNIGVDIVQSLYSRKGLSVFVKRRVREEWNTDA